MILTFVSNPLLQIPNSEFRILHSLFRIPHSKFQILRISFTRCMQRVYRILLASNEIVTKTSSGQPLILFLGYWLLYNDSNLRQ